MSDLLTTLRDLAYGPADSERAVAAWQAIVTSREHELDVGAAYAAEHRLVQVDAAMIRRQSEARRLGKSWRTPVGDVEMVWIPPGPFVWGKYQSVSPMFGFSLARHPVTNAQWKAFVEATDYQPASNHPRSDRYLNHWEQGSYPAGMAAHPAVRISFIDALHYCRWAGLVLPTEWMWEKAARGDDGRHFPWGNQSPSAELAQVYGTESSPVTAFGHVRTAYGCANMVGNVSELCETTYAEVGTGWRRWKEVRQKDHPPLALGAIDLESLDLDIHWRNVQVRGSAYMRIGPKNMRCSHRRYLSITGRSEWVGFRPAFAPMLCRDVRPLV